MWIYLKIACYLIFTTICQAQCDDFLHALAKKYERPITVLDLSPHITNVILDLAALHPSSVFIGVPRKDQRVLPNCLLIKKPPNLSNLKKLYETEHFDVAYIGGGLAEMTNRFEYIKLIAKIADHVVLNLDMDFAKLIPDFLLEINAFSIKINTEQLKQQTYLIKNAGARHITPFPNSSKVEVLSNFHYKIGTIDQSAKAWPTGITLFSFKSLDGILPNTNALAEQLKNSQWENELTLPYCAFLQGNKIFWQRASPTIRIWSEEGLASCLKGIHIPPNQYETYCKSEFRRLLLPN